MSHYYGVLQGARGEATRCGSKGSGLSTTAASWSGAIRVRLYNEDGIDKFIVRQTQWHGAGVDHTIAEGVIGEESDLVKTLAKVVAQRDALQRLIADFDKMSPTLKKLVQASAFDQICSRMHDALTTKVRS